MKAIQYLIVDEERPNDIKKFQEQTSKIRGYFFKRSRINDIEKLEEEASSACIYFLFDNSDEDNKIYIGKSKEGIKRIISHRKKVFWSEAMMFVSDNNSFDETTIDYLEWKFIQDAIKSAYILENIDERSVKPKVNSFNEVALEEIYKQIKFLLRANGIELDQVKVSKDVEVYKCRSEASLVYDDNQFILLKGSKLKRPLEKVKNYADEGAFYNRCMKVIDNLIATEKVSEIDDEYLSLLVDLPCKSSSQAGSLTTGTPINGWEYWIGLDKIRNK